MKVRGLGARPICNKKSRSNPGQFPPNPLDGQPEPSNSAVLFTPSFGWHHFLNLLCRLVSCFVQLGTIFVMAFKSQNVDDDYNGDHLANDDEEEDDNDDDDGVGGVFESSRTFFAELVDPLGRCQVAPSLLYCITLIIIIIMRMITLMKMMILIDKGLWLIEIKVSVMIQKILVKQVPENILSLTSWKQFPCKSSAGKIQWTFDIRYRRFTFFLAFRRYCLYSNT